MFDAAPTPDDALSLQQHRTFANALKSCGRSPVFSDGPNPLLILRRRFPGGVPLSMVSRARHVSLAADLSRIRAVTGRAPVILSPDTPCPDLGTHGAVPLMTPGWVAELNLGGSADTRRARMHQKWRNRLVQAEAGRLRLSHGPLPPDPGHWLLRAEALQRDRRGYRGWPLALTLAYATFHPEQTRLFTASLGRRPVAAMLFLRHGRGASYHIGHTDANGRRLSAHNLLLSAAADWLADQGHTRLDLGLIDTTHAPGLARFKLGAGAEARRLGGTWLWWPPLGRALAPLAALDHRRM